MIKNKLFKRSYNMNEHGAIINESDDASIVDTIEDTHNLIISRETSHTLDDDAEIFVLTEEYKNVINPEEENIFIDYMLELVIEDIDRPYPGCLNPTMTADVEAKIISDYQTNCSCCLDELMCRLKCEDHDEDGDHHHEETTPHVEAEVSS